ncbi:MAG: hypothetical protein RIF46_00085 [Cyclobacteriaceae bacterium]
MKRLEKANERFERAVKKLQSNLQYLADQDKVGDQFLAIQNEIIKALVDYQHEVINTVQRLEELALEVALRDSHEYHELVDIKERFEAICIIHGITDFPVWLAMSKKYLSSEAVIHTRNKEIQLSVKFMQKLRSLPSQERETFWEIMQWNHLMNFQVELEQILKSKRMHARA